MIQNMVVYYMIEQSQCITKLATNSLDNGLRRDYGVIFSPNLTITSTNECRSWFVDSFVCIAH